MISLDFKYISQSRRLLMSAERAAAPIKKCQFFIVSSVGELSENYIFTVVEELSRVQIDLEYLSEISGTKMIDLMFLS